MNGHPDRPNWFSRPAPIGLALGSGVARGWAHIGVLRALERAGIRPDIIAGTSIGAVVGGCYAAGKLHPLEEWATGLTQSRLFRFLDIRLGSSGLIAGNRLADELTDKLGDLEIQHLSQRFIAIATELATGHEIWLREGNLVENLRASYALPGIFNPVRVHNHWLIDGALVNPVPVSVCRAFGARLVIAVNLNADSFGKGTFADAEHLRHDEDENENAEEGGFRALLSAAKRPDRLLLRQLFGVGNSAPGLTDVMFASLNIIQDRLARSRLAGDPPDITINPQVAHVGLVEFHRARELIDLGEEAMEAAIPTVRDALSFLQ